MKIVILSQSYYPDTVSVAQHLTDLAESLVEHGHKVHVVTSIFDTILMIGLRRKRFIMGLSLNASIIQALVNDHLFFGR